MGALAIRLMLEPALNFETPEEVEPEVVEPGIVAPAVVLTPAEHDDVIMMTGPSMRHALLRRAVRARGNQYMLRTLGPRFRVRYR